MVYSICEVMMEDFTCFAIISLYCKWGNVYVSKV